MLGEFNQMLAYATRHASEINGQHAWATGLFDLLNFLDFASDYSDPFANDFPPAGWRAAQAAARPRHERTRVVERADGADLLLNNVLDAYTRLYRVARYTRPDELDGYRKLLDDSVIALVRHHDLIPVASRVRTCWKTCR